MRVALWSLLVLGVAALVAALVIVVPMLTHQSAGGSGQRVPTEYVLETSAVGEDGRTRELRVQTPGGEASELASLEPGEELVVSGDGFDASIGIYVAICAIPDTPEERPSPCLGGIPEGAEEGEAGTTGLSSAWITDDWAWRSFATGVWDDPETGSFTTRITVPEPTVEGLDCRETACAIATRADHTASADRVQDMLLPVGFAR